MSAVMDRLWPKVDKSGSCWLWTASLSSAGYGQLKVDGHPALAHRLTYADANGPIGPDMQIDHMCHIRACVNPAHLQAVTRQINQENRSGATATSSTGIRGVGFHKRSGKWRVFAGKGGRVYDGGLFVDINEAEAAAIALRNKLMSNNLADRVAS